MIEHQTITNWKCGQCLRCQSCQTADVIHFDTEDSTPLCGQCCLQKKKGSYCPLCLGMSCSFQNFYSDTNSHWIRGGSSVIRVYKKRNFLNSPLIFRQNYELVRVA